jgi:hypothetical protein
VQIGVFVPQLLLVGLFCLLLRVVGANVVAVAVPISVGTPAVGLGIITHTFDTALAVTANTMMLACFLLRDNAQVCTPAVEPVVIQKDYFLSFSWLHDLPVKINQAVLASDLGMPDCVTLLAVAFGTVAPAEFGKKRIVLIVNEDDLTLGKFN